MLSNVATRIHNIAQSRSSARVVGMVRIGLGVSALVRSFEAFRILSPLTRTEIARIPWFAWFPEPTTALVLAIVGIWAVAALGFSLGFLTRPSGAVLSAAMAASIAVDQQAYSNHLYLLTVLVGLFVLTNPGSALSVDARRRGHSPETVVGWPVFLMKLQISVVYVFAAITKLNEPFLSGVVLFRQVGSGILPIPESILVPSILAPMAIGAVITELALATLLWRSRGRDFAVLLGLALHGSIILLLAPILQLIVFAGIMLSAYGLFFAEPAPVAAAGSATDSDVAPPPAQDAFPAAA